MNNHPGIDLPKLVLVCAVLVASCTIRTQNTKDAPLVGSWHWVKTWNHHGDHLSPASTRQSQVITFKPDSTYSIKINDSTTAAGYRFHTALARTVAWPDTLVTVVWYDTLKRYQVIEFKHPDTLLLNALDETNAQVAHYSKYYRVK